MKTNNISREYKLMKEIRADYPTFKFAEKEIAKKAGKTTHKNLTFETMREHIILCEGEKSTILEQYDYLMQLYKTHAGRYAKIKSWYLEQCKDEYADENEASEASSESSEASTANVLTMPR